MLTIEKLTEDLEKATNTALKNMETAVFISKKVDKFLPKGWELIHKPLSDYLAIHSCSPSKTAITELNNICSHLERIFKIKLKTAPTISNNKLSDVGASFFYNDLQVLVWHSAPQQQCAIEYEEITVKKPIVKCGHVG